MNNEGFTLHMSIDDVIDLDAFGIPFPKGNYVPKDLPRLDAPKEIPKDYLSPVTYDAPQNDRYRHDEWYTTWFLRPITLGTKESLGWDEGLGGLNYTELGQRFARWDWNHKPAHYVVAHEMKHDGPMFKNHNLAEYWNRQTDPVVITHRRQPLAHQPAYLENYTPA